MTNILASRRLWSVIGLLVVDGLFFTLSNPQQVPSFMLVVGFVLFLASLYCLVRGILAAGRWYGVAFSGRRRRLAGVITGFVGGVVALQSVGELSIRDVLVLVPLTVVAYVYATYAKPVPGTKRGSQGLGESDA